MSKRNRGLPVLRHAIRPGEGTLVDVTVSKFSEPGGTSGAQLAINASNAPVPDRRYVADGFGVIADDQSAKLLFGQRLIGSKTGLRSLLVIHMSPRAVRQFLNSVDNVRNPTFEEIAEKLSITPQGQMKIDEEPEQTVALSANFALCAVSGEEATIDLYQASPFSVLAVIESQKMALDPVVRVDLPSAVFMGLIRELQDVAKRFPVRTE